LPSAIYRALGKAFAVCYVALGKKKVTWRTKNGNGDFAECHDSRHSEKFWIFFFLKIDICRVPHLNTRHTFIFLKKMEFAVRLI
jgi:hypothetical protein